MVAKGLTRVPQLAVPEHRDDDQQIAQHVHHRGEDQHAGQDSYDPGGAGAPLRGQCALQLPQPRLCPVLYECECVRHHWPTIPTLLSRPRLCVFKSRRHRRCALNETWSEFHKSARQVWRRYELVDVPLCDLCKVTFFFSLMNPRRKLIHLCVAEKKGDRTRGGATPPAPPQCEVNYRSLGRYFIKDGPDLSYVKSPSSSGVCPWLAGWHLELPSV